jgi:hypothetical protein
MGDRTASTALFMTAVDEASFSAALLAAIPSVAFVDGQRWPSTDPPLVRTINLARQGEVFLWDRSLVNRLPIATSASGLVQGPISGVVIQFERCRGSTSELWSGRIAAGWDETNEAMANFVNAVWAVIKTTTSRDLESLSGKPFPYRIGADARRWALESSGNRLRDRSVLSAYFRVRTRDRA